MPLLAIALLCGCAAITRTEEGAMRPARAAISRFDIEARISVRRDDQPYQANLAWHHDPARDELLLTGPMGQGIAELVRDASGARLMTADHKQIAAADWSELAEQVFGVRLPLAGIAQWLTGNVAGTESDALGRPLHAVVDGWRIAYPAYESHRRDALPSLMELERGDIEVKLKIDQWQVN